MVLALEQIRHPDVLAATIVLRVLPQALEIEIQRLVGLVLASSDHDSMRLVPSLQSLKQTPARLSLVPFAQPVFCALEDILAYLALLGHLEV